MLKGLNDAIVNCSLYRAESGDSAQRGVQSVVCLLKMKMNRILLILLIFFGTNFAYSQGKFQLTSKVGKTKVSINGVTYQIDSNKVNIPTNFPNFDILKFEFRNHSVICNFKPDTAYCISLACCAEYDVIPLSRFNYDSLRLWNGMDDYEKFKNHFLDKPFISIKTKEKPKDSIYAWHADAACVTEHKLISTDLWRLGVPPKCYYWSNITSISFIMQDNSMAKHNKTLMEELLGMDNIVELAYFYFRLFDNERFIIIFDVDNKTVKLEYE